MSLTSNKNHPGVNKPKGKEQQNEAYLILSEEERAKGFVRPYRDSYIHVGKDIKSHWKGIHRMLDEDEMREHNDEKYVAVMTVLTNEDGSFKGGAFVTQEELDTWKKGERVGGCGVETKMAEAIAETYARDPKFYGATWCMGCNKHIRVDEFKWADGSGETLGS